MIGSLRGHWLYTEPDIWNKLPSVRKAPADFFTELYRTAYDFLQTRPEQVVHQTCFSRSAALLTDRAQGPQTLKTGSLRLLSGSDIL